MKSRLCCCLIALIGALACNSGTKSSESAGLDGAILQGMPSNRIYLISGGHKHYIQTPATVKALNVANQIKTVPDADLEAMPAGITLPDLTSRLIQKASTGEVFFLEGGKRRYVPDAETLKALNVGSQPRGLPDDIIDAIPVGSPVEHVTAH